MPGLLIRWTPEAAEDLRIIHEYIGADSPAAAVRTVTTIYDSCEGLLHFPRKGRVGNTPGTREFALSPLPYILIYQVTDDAVEILQIRHGAQDWKR